MTRSTRSADSTAREHDAAVGVGTRSTWRRRRPAHRDRAMVRRISGSRRLPRSLAISSSTTRSSRAAASTAAWRPSVGEQLGLGERGGALVDGFGATRRGRGPRPGRWRPAGRWAGRRCSGRAAIDAELAVVIARAGPSGRRRRCRRSGAASTRDEARRWSRVSVTTAPGSTWTGRWAWATGGWSRRCRRGRS